MGSILAPKVQRSKHNGDVDSPHYLLGLYIEGMVLVSQGRFNTVRFPNEA